MPRRKPASAKQRKAELQLKRAVKRGDVPPPDPKKPNHHRKSRSVRIGPTGQILGSAGNAATAAIVKSARRLQSSFIKLPPRFLEETRALASTLALPRPIPLEAAIFTDHTISRGKAGGVSDRKTVQLSCPKRPKWRFDMTKDEVEKNEEGFFKKWIDQMDDLVEEWQKEDDHSDSEEEGDAEKKEEVPKSEVLEMPRAPTYYERNLEVWRQLYV